VKKEIEAAVNWWVDILKGNPNHDNGESLQSIFANLCARTLKPLSEEKIYTFRLSLTEGITKRIEKLGHDPNNPMWGSSLRCFGTDYHPDVVLAEAAEKAEIDAISLRFPIKTLMWINPGEVTVSRGYGAKSEVIYPS